jgi:hypothetical protein
MNDQPYLPGLEPSHEAEDCLTIRLSKVHQPLAPPGGSPNLDEAVWLLRELAECVGEYETPADLSRAIALILTPIVAAMGFVTPQECSPCRIVPGEAKAAFRAILEGIYGETLARQGCRLL